MMVPIENLRELERIIEQLRVDQSTQRNAASQLAQQNARLHAQVTFWQKELDRVKTLSIDTVNKLTAITHKIVNEAAQLVQADAGHCKDCDVKALLEKIEALRPFRIGDSGSQTPSARNHS